MSAKFVEIEAGKFYRTRGGEKVGPMEPSHSGIEDYPWRAPQGGSWLYHTSGRYGDGTHDEQRDIVAEWHEGPVRTITRKEVVLGAYGPLQITAATPSSVVCSIKSIWLDAEALRTAADLLLEVADALDVPSPILSQQEKAA